MVSVPSNLSNLCVSSRRTYSTPGPFGVPEVEALGYTSGAAQLSPVLRASAPGRFREKKFFGLFAVLGAAAAALMFWRKRQNDDEFLDEELE